MDASLDGAFLNEIRWCHSSPEENEMIFDERNLRKCKEPKEIIWTAGFYEWSLSKPAGMKEESCLFCTAPHYSSVVCLCWRETRNSKFDVFLIWSWVLETTHKKKI